MSLPRLARQSKWISRWADDYRESASRQDAAELASISGIEGLAVFAPLSEEARMCLLAQADLDDDDRQRLTDIVAHLGDVGDTGSLASHLVRSLPTASNAGAALLEETAPSVEAEVPTSVDEELLPRLAATVERWPDEASGMDALDRLSHAAHRFGSPLSLSFWLQAAKRARPAPDARRLAIRMRLGAILAAMGEPRRSLEMWQDSLPLWDTIGDEAGKAATLSNMAGVIAQQGDVGRALGLWNESLELDEKIGDVKGKAATLANMAWAARQQKDHARARELYTQAATALAQVRAWLDLVTVLSNLGASDDPEAAGFLAQAMWLILRVEAPVDAAINVAGGFVMKVGVEAEASPLAATFASFLAATRGQGHPRQEELKQRAGAMLGACAAARKIPEDKAKEWIESEGLDDPKRFIPALSKALEAMVPADAWLFDRSVFSPSS